MAVGKSQEVEEYREYDEDDFIKILLQYIKHVHGLFVLIKNLERGFLHKKRP